MGYSSTEQNILLFLSALERLLTEEGYKTETGTGITAAAQSLRK
jgi:aspartate aminotransferase-like enzyme